MTIDLHFESLRSYRQGMLILSHGHGFRLIFFLTAGLFLTVASATFAQSPNPQPKIVRQILIQGNDDTREETILREMKLKPGDAFDEDKLEQDRLQIQNLGIFNRVEMDQIPTNSGVIIVVTVSEMWHIFPYPIIFRNDRAWRRVSYGAGLLNTNFRGRREVLDFSGWLGFNPALNLKYSNPWIFGAAKFYTDISFFIKKVRNRTFTVLDSVVNEEQIGFRATLGKRFGHFTYFDMKIGYRQLSFLGDINATLSPSGKDHLPSLGFAFRYDSRDLHEYPHKGHYLNVWATQTGFRSKTVDYLRYGLDIREYFPLKDATFAFRLATNLAKGKIPVYEQVHLGFLTRIRGHFREKSIGENIAVASAALRFPILPVKYFTWGPFDETMGQYGANFRYGVSGGVFYDTGKIWFDNLADGADFNKAKRISGWGGGLHLFMPYNLILRLEGAFDEDWNSQFIVDAMVAF